jgi:hypothetical protein
MNLENYSTIIKKSLSKEDTNLDQSNLLQKIKYR